MIKTGISPRVAHETIPLRNWYSTIAEESSLDSPDHEPASLVPASDYLVPLNYIQNHGSASHDRQPSRTLLSPLGLR